MGAKASRSKQANKEIKENNRKTTIQQQINKVVSLNQSIVNANANANANADGNGNNGMTNTLVTPNQMAAIQTISTVATTQLQRDTKPLIKSDLIAILIKLRGITNPEEIGQMIQECNRYTVGELNSIIRCVVFDVSTPPTTTSMSLPSVPSPPLPSHLPSHPPPQVSSKVLVVKPPPSSSALLPWRNPQT